MNRIQKQTVSTVTFKGKKYDTRVLREKDGGFLYIGGTSLLDAMKIEESNDGDFHFPDKETERMYDYIFYFVSDCDMDNLMDDELCELVLSENPDFEDIIDKEWCYKY